MSRRRDVVWIHAIFSLTSVCSRFSMLSMRVSQEWVFDVIGSGRRSESNSKLKRTFCFRIYPKLSQAFRF